MRMVPALAGGLWLATGPAQAQTVQREPVACPSIDFDGNPFPPFTQCFSEYTEAPAAEWRERIAEAMLCEAGEADCGPTAQEVFDAAREDHTLLFLDPSGIDARPPRGCAEGFGIASSSCFIFWTAETTSRTETVTTVDETAQSDVFETRITGSLNGGVVFDQTVAGAVGDGAAQVALADAGLAVTDAGGPGVVGFDPVLVERTETLISDETVTVRQVQGDPVEPLTLTLVVGSPGGGMSAPIGTPGPVVLHDGRANINEGGTFTGDYGLCATPGATNQVPTGCENDDATVVVPFPVGLNLFNLSTHTDILETITGTEVWEIYEHWEVAGVVQAVGAIHAELPRGVRDLGAACCGSSAEGAQDHTLQAGITIRW